MLSKKKIDITEAISSDVIRYVIFSFLPAKDVLRFMLVSKVFTESLEPSKVSNSFWKMLVKRDFPDYTKEIADHKEIYKKIYKINEIKNCFHKQAFDTNKTGVQAKLKKILDKSIGKYNIYIFTAVKQFVTEFTKKLEASSASSAVRLLPISALLFVTRLIHSCKHHDTNKQLISDYFTEDIDFRNNLFDSLYNLIYMIYELQNYGYQDTVKELMVKCLIENSAYRNNAFDQVDKLDDMASLMMCNLSSYDDITMQFIKISLDLTTFKELAKLDGSFILEKLNLLDIAYCEDISMQQIYEHFKDNVSEIADKNYDELPTVANMSRGNQLHM